MRTLITAVALMLSSTAYATDFSHTFIDLDNKEVIDDQVCAPDKDGKRPCTNLLTLQLVCIRSLMASFPDERELAGEEKLKRFQTAMKIKSDVAASLTSEETTLVKKLVGKAYPTLIVGQSYPILDPAQK